MAVPFSNTKLRVPQGFQTLLEMLSREILREKPNNIYEFSANYLDQLVRNRENGHLDPILKQSLLDDRFYNNHSFKTEPPVNGENTNEAATRIQANYKGHVERSEAETSEAETSADRANESTSASPVVDDESNVNPQVQQQDEPRTEPESAAAQVEQPAAEPDEDEDEEKLKEEAATRIQATFRGYKTRKSFNSKSKVNTVGETNEQESNPAPASPPPETQTPATLTAAEDNSQPPAEANNNAEKNLDEAATKIQATFRGFKTRKELKKGAKQDNNAQQQQLE